MNSPYVYSRVRAWCVIDGAETPLASATIAYELNASPVANLTVPLGVDARTGRRSTLVDLAAGEAEPVPVEVYASVDLDGEAVELGYESGEEVKIFEGWTAGYGAVKSRSPARLAATVPLRHWLSELDYSSVFSRWSHPSNPAQYSAAAVLTVAGAGAAAGGTSYVGPYDPKGVLTVANVQSDLWKDCLLPFFTELAQVDGLYVAEGGAGGGAAQPSANDPALAALARITSRPSLALSGGVDANLAGAIRADLAALLAGRDALASSTFWDLIAATLAGEYLFSVVPRIEDALVTPCLVPSKAPYKTLPADEIWTCDIQGAHPRPTRAYGVLGYLDSSTGARGMADARAARAALGGWYQVPGRDKGMVKIVQGPRWSMSTTSGVVPTATAVGAFGAVLPTADQPDAGPGGGADVADAQAAAAESAHGFLSRYARSRLAQEHSAGSQGVVSGPYRLDVAPGSALRLAIDDGRYWTDQHGTVFRASIAITAGEGEGGGVAQTSFHLGCVRTDAANEAAGVALDSHPLYAEPFRGASLRKD